MHYFPGERWYALRVRHRHEAITERCLAQKRFEPLLLSYQERSRRKDRRKILTKFFFPGYMFVKTTLDAERHVEILKSVGVVELLRNSKGPIPIQEDQIQNVQRLKDYEGQILIFNEYQKGMMVRIIQGPLTGVIGRVDEARRDLLSISIDSIPGSVAIQVTPDQLEPLDTTRASLPELIRDRL